jgi:hypothetical protein
MLIAFVKFLLRPPFRDSCVNFLQEKVHRINNSRRDGLIKIRKLISRLRAYFSGVVAVPVRRNTLFLE